MEEIEQPMVDQDCAQPDLSDGSIMGKFKDATSLSNAYANLQAEFTRKSQKLAELERLVKEQADQLSKQDNAPTFSNNQGEKNLEQTAKLVSDENNCCEQKESQNNNYEAEINTKLLKFAENVPDAVNYLTDIKAELSATENLANIDGGVEIAYRLASQKDKVKPAELLTDPNYITNYILSNNTIKQMVIDNYIKSLAQGETPKVISGQTSSTVITPNPNQPKSLQEANKIFTRMLEK